METGLTYEKIWELFKETDKKMQETDRQIQETGRQMKETDKQIQETGKQMKETDRRIQETERQMKEMSKVTDRKLRKLEELFTGQWGKLMESLVEGDLIPLLNARNIPVNTILQRARKTFQKQYYEIDLIARNGQEVVFIEVKTTLKPDHVQEFLDKLQKIKIIFPEYSQNTVYGAVAYLRAESNSHSFAMKNGLFVIQATGKSATITNPEDFQPVQF